MATKPKTNPPSNDVLTYRKIRRAIGILGMALPVVLLLLSCIPYFGTDVQYSISDYYYTHFREIFTGILCAVGLFLIMYVGHKNKNIFKNDSLLTNIAGFMAFGIALFPTDYLFVTDDHAPIHKAYTLFPIYKDIMGWIHYGFAAVFFGILAIIAINVFTIGQNKDRSIPKSALNENNIYKTCGIIIALSIVCIPIFGYFNLFNYSTLLFEAFALFAFGIAWLIKGRGLGDTGARGRILYREDN